MIVSLPKCNHGLNNNRHEKNKPPPFYSFDKFVFHGLRFQEEIPSNGKNLPSY